MCLCAHVCDFQCSDFVMYVRTQNLPYKQKVIFTFADDVVGFVHRSFRQAQSRLISATHIPPPLSVVECDLSPSHSSSRYPQPKRTSERHGPPSTPCGRTSMGCGPSASTLRNPPSSRPPKIGLSSFGIYKRRSRPRSE